MKKPFPIRDGMTFGKLTVVTEKKAYSHSLKSYLCRCECGRHSIQFASSLRNGKAKCSCEVVNGGRKTYVRH